MLVEKIIKMGLMEKKEIRNEKRNEYVEKNGITENTLINPIFSRIVFSLDEVPVYIETFNSHDPKICATYGKFCIKYLPKGCNQRKGCLAFLITQDLIHAKILVANYGHWEKLSERIPELRWLKRNTTLTRELFDLARLHPGIFFPFCIDYNKYVNKLKQIDPKLEKAFVNFACDLETYNKYKDLQLRDAPRNGIIQIIREVEKDYEH